MDPGMAPFSKLAHAMATNYYQNKQKTYKVKLNPADAPVFWALSKTLNCLAGICSSRTPRTAQS